MNSTEMTAPEASAPVEEANRRVVQRFYEVAWATGNFGLLDELLTPDYEHHDPALPVEWQHGREAYKQLTAAFKTAFPDLQVQVAEQVAEADRVAARWTWQGTHQGVFQGIPPTGKRVAGSGLSIQRLVGGQIAETWIVFDALGLLQQLGVVPPPA